MNNGLFQLDPATGASTLVGLGRTGVTTSTVGLTETGDPELLLGSRFFGMLQIAADGSGSTLIGTTGMEGMAYDPRSGILYGAINGEFFTVDPVTGSLIQTLAAPGDDVEGLAALDGKIYGVTRESSRLLYYSPATNTWTLVGDVGVSIFNPGLASDPLRKTLYFKGLGQNLYRIDPDTAAATLIGSTGISNGGGLAFVRSPSRPDVSVSGTGTSEIGAGVINSTGAGQVARIQPGSSRKSASYEAKFKLTPLDKEDILKASAFVSRANPTVTYNGSNVTAEVLAGTWQSEILDPSESVTLSARFLSKNLRGRKASLFLTVASYLKPQAKDTAGMDIAAPRKQRPSLSKPNPAAPRVPLNP